MGRVSRVWRVALQQPSLWREIGWRFPANLAAHPIPLPLWLQQRLGKLSISAGSIMLRESLVCLKRFRSLLDVEFVQASDFDSRASAPTAQQIRAALLPLHLRRLRLPSTFGPTDQPLLKALITAELRDGTDSPSLLSTWSSTLTSLTCHVRLTGEIELLSALASRQWPALQDLQLTCTDVDTFGMRSPHHADSLPLLSQLMTPDRMPLLTVFKCPFNSIHQHSTDLQMALTTLWCNLLHRFQNLVEIDVGYCSCCLPPNPPGLGGLPEPEPALQQSALSVIQHLGPDALPQLRTLHMACMLPMLQNAAERQQVALHLRRMPLTALKLSRLVYRREGDWLELLHELSQLEMLHLEPSDRSSFSLSAATLNSIATAPIRSLRLSPGLKSCVIFCLFFF
jgi:hypothetical protein